MLAEQRNVCSLVLCYCFHFSFLFLLLLSVKFPYPRLRIQAVDVVWLLTDPGTVSFCTYVSLCVPLRIQIYTGSDNTPLPLAFSTEQVSV